MTRTNGRGGFVTGRAFLSRRWSGREVEAAVLWSDPRRKGSPSFAAHPQGYAEQHEVFGEELAGDDRQRREAAGRRLPDAGGREQEAQRGQEHAGGRRAAEQGGPSRERPRSDEQGD